MDDSDDLLGGGAREGRQEEARPSAAEMEAAGQSALFGAEPEPATPPSVLPAESETQAETPEPSPVAVPAAPQVAETASAAPSQPYRVLARKYRPQTFAELIGQDAMVKTLANAIARDRLAHAFLMTGVRGVGKTSTARLIAKALNCIGPDGQGGPTIDPCGQCEPCVAIAEGRHIDVIEMDAASHTGVDDVREIIEAVRYAAVSARYKIYIIDEVHMLSRNAFNALLKTLEEPPAHVKFLFATTEVDKLPVTVLSRCQRFDLRRITQELLEKQFADICEKEGVAAEAEALAIIASAAEGSSRDGLSILDQAIAHADLDLDVAGAGASGGGVTAERVRDMLGLADRGAVRRLFGALMDGEPAALLDAIDNQYALGVEPLALIRSLMEFVNRITVAQIGRSGGDAPTAEERAAIEDWAKRLSPGQMHRLWQLLLKGHDEVRNAPDPLIAAQMALLRILHAADLPDPGDLVKQLEELAARTPAVPVDAAPGDGASAAMPAPVAAVDWQELINTVDHSGQLRMAQLMQDWVRVIELAPGRLVYSLAPGLSEDPSAELRDALLKATGQRWQVDMGQGDGAPALRELAEALAADEAARIRNAPMVKAAFEAFPGAELVDEDEAPTGSDRNWSKSA